MTSDHIEPDASASPSDIEAPPSEPGPDAEPGENELVLAIAIAQQYAPDRAGAEELLPVVWAALAAARDRFDAAADDDFLAFAAPAVAGEVRRHLRDTAWPQRQPDAPAPPAPGASDGEEGAAEPSGATATHEAAAPDGQSEQSSRALIDSILSDGLGHRLAEDPGPLEPALERLPESVRKLLVQRFVHGRSPVEIGEDSGLPQMAVSEQVKDALDQLHADLDPE